MSGFLIRNAWLVPFFPLLGGLIAATAGRQLRERAHLPVIAGILLAFLVSLGLLFSAEADAKTLVLNWLDTGDSRLALHVPIEFRVDGLTTMMLSMVTFVSTLVAVFASGYMAGEEGYPRFFAVVGLFVFSMTGLVLSNNYLLTYGFWEGVGACSYLLVGFWHSKPSAAAAAKKAFLVNRVGDVGFAIAIFWMWSVSANHDLSYDNVLSQSNLHLIPYAAVQGIALLLFWAATAKSAQIPLYVWLPDAMEGPTPVSALIHAATMVTAGVYLLARSTPLLVMAPLVQMTVCLVGCSTALLAALIALTQTDLKRVLAYSTVSQLGFMFMALGAAVGNVARFAVFAAMFHLFTHAFFKALLFLGSGSVMHSMGGVIDMRRFSGLRHRLPYTFWTFAVGGIALSGIPILSGFWSKDDILVSLQLAAHWEATDGLGYASVYKAIYWVAVFTAGLTAFYTGRAFFMTFFGPEKLPRPDDPEAPPQIAHDHHDADEDSHASHHLGEESGPLMTIPLVVLAVCAAFVGIVFGPTHLFQHHIEHTFGFQNLLPGIHHDAGWGTPLIGTLAGVLGLSISYVFYATGSPIPDRLARTLNPLYRASLNKFSVDEIYEALIVRTTLITAKFSAFIDTYMVEGLVVLVSWIPRLVGKELLGPYQNGLIQFYAAVTALGIVGLLWILLLS
ncbi:MAG: NAD(P)H-quinone oxidoreductase subunit 5 [Isosphaeraceae bacterium]